MDQIRKWPKQAHFFRAPETLTLAKVRALEGGSRTPGTLTWGVSGTLTLTPWKGQS